MEILQSAKQVTARSGFHHRKLKVKYYDQIYRLKDSGRAPADLGKYQPVGQGRPPECQLPADIRPGRHLCIPPYVVAVRPPGPPGETIVR
jgi:hypothetical protein